jgi:hypothetical protein
MAQSSHFVVTATKIVRPNQSVQYAGAGIEVGVITQDAIFLPVDGVTDTLIITGSGWQITAQEDFADFVTAVSATDVTGS